MRVNGGNGAGAENAARVAILPAVSIVVPTRNEAGNVRELVQRLAACVDVDTTEVVFVDDSDDDTPQVVEEVATSSRLKVRLVHREPEDRTGGLGGAVIAGLDATDSPWVLVMDADLQHPPETVPDLLSACNNDTDVVIASRYVDGGQEPASATVLAEWPSTLPPRWCVRCSPGACAK